MPNPSPEALEQALNVLMVQHPIKNEPPVKKLGGGLMEVWESTLLPTEADVYRLAGQLDTMANGGRIISGRRL